MKTQEIKLKITEDTLLAPHTYYKIGGKARYFCEASNTEEVINSLDFAHKNNVPIFVLGGGTNILVSDEGFDGLVIKMDNESQITTDNNLRITVSAGTSLSRVVNFAHKNNFSGIEWAAGIPGTIGGAIRGNAGAFGSCMADIIESAKCLNVDEKKVISFSNKKLEFEYRNSFVKKEGNFVVLSATLLFKKINNAQELQNTRKTIERHIKYRKDNHPLEHFSCGSVFKNVRELDIKKNKELLGDIKDGIAPVALLIAKTGIAGKIIGNAQISEKHSNFIINLGNAKAKDVRELIELCQIEVYKKFGVKLEPEVQFVGF
jgi:UDP-N-acetylmuramate dehydrogenase